MDQHADQGQTHSHLSGCCVAVADAVSLRRLSGLCRCCQAVRADRGPTRGARRQGARKERQKAEVIPLVTSTYT